MLKFSFSKNLRGLKMLYFLFLTVRPFTYSYIKENLPEREFVIIIRFFNGQNLVWAGQKKKNNFLVFLQFKLWKKSKKTSSTLQILKMFYKIKIFLKLSLWQFASEKPFSRIVFCYFFLNFAKVGGGQRRTNTKL